MLVSCNVFAVWQTIRYKLSLGELLEAVMLFFRENRPLRPFKSFITPDNRGFSPPQAAPFEGLPLGVFGFSPCLWGIDNVATLCYNRCMRTPSHFRLSTEALALLEKMSQASGISRTAMLEIAIREAAKKRNITLTQESKER
jgi:hypothetical protein